MHAVLTQGQNSMLYFPQFENNVNPKSNGTTSTWLYFLSSNSDNLYSEFFITSFNLQNIVFQSISLGSSIALTDIVTHKHSSSLFFANNHPHIDNQHFTSSIIKLNSGIITDSVFISSSPHNSKIIDLAATDTNTIVVVSYDQFLTQQALYITLWDTSLNFIDTIAANINTGNTIVPSRLRIAFKDGNIVLAGFGTNTGAFFNECYKIVIDANGNYTNTISMDFVPYVQSQFSQSEAVTASVFNLLGPGNDSIFPFNSEYSTGIPWGCYFGLLKVNDQNIPVDHVFYTLPTPEQISYSDMCFGSDSSLMVLAVVDRCWGSNFGGESIKLLKFDRELNLLWERHYPRDPDIISYFSSSFTAIPVGYCVAGIAYEDITYTPKGFLLFVDENGSPLEVKEQINTTSLSIFPNPNNGSFHLTWPQEKILSVEIYTLSGACIHQQNAFGNESLTIDLDLSNGVYFIHAINAKGNPIVKRVVVAK
ncbi:MAG: T9SS type A sorting domain-containing protein [Flavobacteriales bacterium]